MNVLSLTLELEAAAASLACLKRVFVWHASDRLAASKGCLLPSQAAIFRLLRLLYKHGLGVFTLYQSLQASASEACQA